MLIVKTEGIVKDGSKRSIQQPPHGRSSPPGNCQTTNSGYVFQASCGKKKEHYKKGAAQARPGSELPRLEHFLHSSTNQPHRVVGRLASSVGKGGGLIGQRDLFRCRHCAAACSNDLHQIRAIRYADRLLLARTYRQGERFRILDVQLSELRLQRWSIHRLSKHKSRSARRYRRKIVGGTAAESVDRH